MYAYIKQRSQFRQNNLHLMCVRAGVCVCVSLFLKSLATHLDSYNLSTPSITGICSSICIYTMYSTCIQVSIKLSCMFRLIILSSSFSLTLCRYLQHFISLLIVYVYNVQVSIRNRFYFNLAILELFFVFFLSQFSFFTLVYLSGLHSYQFECGFRLFIK